MAAGATARAEQRDADPPLPPARREAARCARKTSGRIGRFGRTRRPAAVHRPVASALAAAVAERRERRAGPERGRRHVAHRPQDWNTTIGLVATKMRGEHAGPWSAGSAAQEKRQPHDERGAQRHHQERTAGAEARAPPPSSAANPARTIGTIVWGCGPGTIAERRERCVTRRPRAPRSAIGCGPRQRARWPSRTPGSHSRTNRSRPR